MKKQLSSLDLHFLVKELKQLEDSRVDKIYQPEKEIIVFSFHKANQGKKFLKINIGQSIHLIEDKEEYGETLGFGMFLRKHLDGYFLDEIRQIEPERIARFDFRVKDEKKTFYIELFGKGNAILCNEHNIILNALEHHDFRERSVRPKLKYAYPMMNYNIFELKKSEMADIFRNSKKESAIVSLATELGLGGLYSEEVCLLSVIDKNTIPKNTDTNQVQSILDSIKKIISHEPDPKVVLDEDKVIDFIPFELEFYKNKEKKKFSTFSEAIQYFYSQFKEEKETEYDKKLKSLQRIIDQQTQTIDELRKEEHELRQKGEMIYHNYNVVKEILEEINKASKKYPWKEIKEKLRNHKTIKEINEKDRKVVVEI